MLLTVAVQTKGVNIPFGDQWEFAYLLERWERGEVVPSNLWSQHNEHRILVPRLIMLALARISHWNVKWEMFTSIVLATGILALLALMVRRTSAKIHPKLFATLVLVVPWLIFSPVQWENWLWGWQIQWFLTVLGMVGSASALALWPEPRALTGVGVAMTSAAIATLSMSMGVLIWFACLPVYLTRPPIRRYWWLWAMGGFVTVGLFFRGYMKPLMHPPLASFIDTPTEFAEYVAIYLGGAVATTLSSAMVVGAALTLVFALASLRIVFWRSRANPVAGAWLAMALFCFLSAIITAIGRLGFGTAQAAASRYTTVAILFLISVAMLALHAFAPEQPIRSKSIRPVGIAFLTLIGIALYVSYERGYEAMDARRDFMLETRSCVLEVESPDDPCLATTFPPSGEYAWERSRFLIKKGWGGL